MKRFRLLSLGLVVVACGGSEEGLPDASIEAGGPKDSGAKDSTTMMIDSGSDAQPSDAQPSDAQPSDSASEDGASDGGGGDASDGGDAGDSGDGAVTAQCTVPATPPSGGSCITIDDAAIQCNPVTNFPCDADAGLGCDTDFDGGYQCLGLSTVNLCGSCNEVNGPYCIGTATCLPLTDSGTQQCFRYCCTDSDCSPGHCNKTAFGISPVGACTP